jgi:carbonic anhydrase/acetyltransferase-like protein (isoleucine patch superfamily)
MLMEHQGKRPRIDDSAYVAPNATLCVVVVVGAGC